MLWCLLVSYWQEFFESMEFELLRANIAPMDCFDFSS